jgi:hypothetical protein
MKGELRLEMSIRNQIMQSLKHENYEDKQRPLMLFLIFSKYQKKIYNILTHTILTHTILTHTILTHTINHSTW